MFTCASTLPPPVLKTDYLQTLTLQVQEKAPKKSVLTF